MSIADKLTKLNTDITNAYNSISEKGGTIPAKKNTENLASAIESITGGGTITYTVTFDSDGGSEVASQQIVSGYTAKEPDAPAKEGYTLNYWALNGVEYDFNTPVTSDITLVAEWKPEYTELEYIESTGTQYIDTGYVASSNTAVEIDFQIIGSSTTDAWQPFFGFRDFINNPQTGITCYYNRTTKTAIAYVHSDYDVQGTLSKVVTNRTKLKFDKYGVHENGNQVITLTPKTFSAKDSLNSMTIFAQKVNDADTKEILMNDRRQLMKLYSFMIYEDSVLVKDFIPTLDKNNVACLFDKVSETFFYNKGTGSFTAGPVI